MAKVGPDQVTTVVAVRAGENVGVGCGGDIVFDRYRRRGRLGGCLPHAAVGACQLFRSP